MNQVTIQMSQRTSIIAATAMNAMIQTQTQATRQMTMAARTI